jgi:phosphoribosylglycinamide formyltransferase-1
LQALIDKINGGYITGAKIAVVVSSNYKAYAIKRAEENGIPYRVISKKDFSSIEEFDRAMLTYAKSTASTWWYWPDIYPC